MRWFNVPAGYSPLSIRLPGRDSGQQLETLIDGIDRIDREPALSRSSDNIVAQHQMPHVARWNDHTLAAGKAGLAAAVEESLDLFVDAANRLDLTPLIDRASNRKALFYRRFCQSREQRKQLRG